ncbi:MAG: heavy-metal-associated domain-containing protein [Desulfobacterales bacterium]|nr:heavy-metal-associated domain-containing protein [Desulfobacterales bacterium]
MKMNEQKIRLQIKNIVCTGCAMDMETVLLDTDGILAASVNYQDGIITILYDPEDIGEEQVVAKVRSFNFETAVLGK